METLTKLAEELTSKSEPYKSAKEHYCNHKSYFENERMQKYYKSSTQLVIPYLTEENTTVYLPIDKPYIQKSFCFGYGMYLQCTDEEQNRARQNLEKARTDFNYFMSENLSDLNRKIYTMQYFLLSYDKTAESYEKSHKFYQEHEQHISYKSTMCTPYLVYSSYVDNKQVNISYYTEEEIPYEENRTFINSDKGIPLKHFIRKATKEDLEKYITGLLVVRKEFIKRLNTYLKKYGLSKLKTWTYLVD